MGARAEEGGRAAPPGRTRNTAILLTMAALALLVVGAGVMVALGSGGLRRYASRPRRAEGALTLKRLADGVQTCAQGKAAGQASATRLPPSSPRVPASLSSVRGESYTSTAADWEHPTWVCAGFKLTTPQAFQFRWELLAPERGIAKAEADFDGDGQVDAAFEIDVECPAGEACRRGPMRER